MKPIVIAIDCAGFNYSERILNDKLIKELDLNPIQVHQLKTFQEIYINSVTSALRINYNNLEETLVPEEEESYKGVFGR